MIYLIGMIFVSGMHPVQVLLHLKDQLAAARAPLVGAPDSRGRLAAEDTALLGFSEPAPARVRRKRLVPESEDLEDDAGLELPLMPQRTPPPKIFDASAPKPPKTKPQLSEVWKEQRDEKRERAAAAPPASLTARYANYAMPRLDLLSWPDLKGRTPADEHALRETQTTIIKTLANFGITVTAGDITKGPAITRYEVYPSDGLRVSRIANLEADLARATKAERINILAPIPGKDTVGIELPNSHKIVVPIRELLEDDAFQNGKAKIPLALGKDVYGKAIIADLASMPHLLVAGATGSGKSVCINSIVTSLLCRFAPDELRFIMIDPKVVEMQGYKELPHLALPVVTDPKQSLLALRWVVNEMEKRYHIFAEEGCRNFDTFNARAGRKKPGAQHHPLRRRKRSRAGTGREDGRRQKQAREEQRQTPASRQPRQRGRAGHARRRGRLHLRARRHLDGQRRCHRRRSLWNSRSPTPCPTSSSSSTSWPTSCRPRRRTSNWPSAASRRRRAPPAST